MDLELAFPVDQSQYAWKTWQKPLPWNAFDQPDWSASSSQSRLFKLPTELLHRIVDSISDTDLATLALVNSDCCRLVLPRLCRRLKIEARHWTPAILDLVVEERLSSRLPQVSSASCLRHLQIDNRWNAGVLKGMPTFISKLPNLEAFSYYKQIETDDTELWLALSVSNVRHLHYVDHVYTRHLLPPVRLTGRRKWSLESLQISTIGENTDLLLDLLSVCSHSVKRIRMTTHGKYKYLKSKKGTSAMNYNFEKLTDLTLSGFSADGGLTMADVLVSSPHLRALSIVDGQWRLWDDESSDIERILTRFLLNNSSSQLVSLALPASALASKATQAMTSSMNTLSHFEVANVDYDNDDDHGVDNIMQFYLNCFPAFSNLRKLSLTLCAWHDVLTREFQDLLRSLPGLQMLTLKRLDAAWLWNAGRQAPAHDRIRQCLTPLSNLTHLAFLDDCIKGWRPGYHRQSEDRHRKTTLEEARKYAETLPSLQWMFVGQYPISLSTTGPPQFLSADRLEGRLYVNRMISLHDPMTIHIDYAYRKCFDQVAGLVDEGLDETSSDESIEE